MDSKELLSDIVVFSKYAKYIPELKRRETWIEICNRTMNMHIKKYPLMESEIRQVFDCFVKTKKVLTSMRSAHFGGNPIEKSPVRMYNCSYSPIDSPVFFSETMFLLLSGCGCGYSVQKHHVEKLPSIKKPGRPRRFLISDQVEGWADAVKMLCKAYFYGKCLPSFDFSDIRAKGVPLKTAGGKAPGPEPLKTCLHSLQMIFERKQVGEQLSTLECHDIACHIALAVVSGGIRRSSCIALFSIDDDDMLGCKTDKWYEVNPQRAMANNSAVLVRHLLSKEDFVKIWGRIRASGCGEPGIYLSNYAELGTNPCCEISLKPQEFCNLSEINISDIKDQTDLNERAKAAAFLGTLQASYTNFHYLRDMWKRNTEKDALLGVSSTGIASNNYLRCDLSEAALLSVQENIRVASLLGINRAKRITCVKPSGTSSLVLGTSSGIHAWYAPYYIRRMKLQKSDPLYSYLKKEIPSLIEDDFFKPKTDAFVFVPIKAPEGATTSDSETALELLSRVKHFYDNWIKPGHVEGDNTNNISATVYVDDDEWEDVVEWMWDNKNSYNGLSVLPKSKHTYVQTPFECVTKERYEELLQHCHKIDLTQVIEEENNVDLKSEQACANGLCELTY